MMNKTKTCDLKRELPGWVRVAKVINSIPIYNISVFQNIIFWNQHNIDVPAIDYYGNIITYGQLPNKVNEYVCGFKQLGIKEKDVVTISLPPTIENMLSLLALNHIGVISNNVNYLFLKSNLKEYTYNKNSNTIIILDAFLPEVIDSIEDSQIKNVIIVSLNDNLPGNKKDFFEDLSYLPKKQRDIFDNKEKQIECLSKMKTINNVNFISMNEIVELGKNNYEELVFEPVNINRDSRYSYTSGTTGKPKCIVYKELAANALIELHIGVNTKDYVGERVFQVIPLTHATGEMFCGYLQMARGKTMVPQPIYNKETFGKDVMESKCNWITAAPSFYLAGIKQGLIDKNAFTLVTRPSSGGEPVTKSNVTLIDRWLKMNGCKVRFSIGGGAAEDGSSTICSYFMDENTKTNETGHPVEPGIKARIVDSEGNILGKGKRGFLEISSPAAADRYLNDPEATDNRWYHDRDGVRWGVTGDIAVQNKDGSYNILGRADDSYIDENGEKKYLFDIEYSLDENDPVVEWEITAHETEHKTYIVGQVVLKDDIDKSICEITEQLCEKYNLDAIKYYEKFENSDVTGKRDFQKLKSDKSNYYAPFDDEKMLMLSFENHDIQKKFINKPRNI